MKVFDENPLKKKGLKRGKGGGVALHLILTTKKYEDS